MEYRSNPKNGDKLSVLGFGCMRFPRGLNTRIDLDKTEELILTALEAGVNYFDTAYTYGGSEVTLGEILAKNQAREKIFLATKLPYRQCQVYEDFDRLFKVQLERLNSDYFDYYLIHNISASNLWENLCELGIERWIAEKKANGQIRQIGFSFHGPQNNFLDLLDAYKWDFCQIQYNYLNENYQAGRLGLQKAHEKGLPVIIMDPLLGGKLANGLPRPSQKLFYETNPSLSSAAWALRWLWDQPEVTVVLSGMNSLEQLIDNISSAEGALPGVLTEKEAAVYTAVVADLQKTYKIPCTGCNYCMPCPHKVNIPGCFAAYNASYATGFVTGMQQYITSTGANHLKKDYSGRNCMQCGKCEKACPQHIGIIKSLQTATRRMEPFWFKALMKIVSKK